MPRIYDQPGHPSYGPCRRLWVILLQLGIITWTDSSKADKPFNKPWDQVVDKEYQETKDEAETLRLTLTTILMFISMVKT